MAAPNFSRYLTSTIQPLFKDRNLSTSNWLVIDQKGLEIGVCLLAILRICRMRGSVRF